MSLLPHTFLRSVANCPGFDEQAFIAAHERPSPTSIRLNPFKPALPEFDLSDPVAWNPEGFYLAERPSFTHDLLFQAGCYYVQEAGSMFIGHALKSGVDFDRALTVLDACAAPGGKSTLLNSMIGAESLLVANEVVKARAEVLAQNLAKWGTCNAIVTNNDPAMYAGLGQVFDVMVVDAPCSGSGLFRKQHDAVDEWSPDSVNLCSQRQKRILAELLPALRPGGVLLYSTCSYSASENEDIADWLLEQGSFESLQVPVSPGWGIVETRSSLHQAFGYRFYPDKTRSEGFFCAMFRKAGAGDSAAGKKNKQPQLSPLKPKEKEPFRSWVKNIEAQELVKFREDYLLLNEAGRQFVNRYPQLYYKKVGTNLGSLLRGELIPHHDLALSIHRADATQQIDCTKEVALKFLKKELQAAEGEKGWNLMSCQGYGLGWIKNLGNRINNYLPNEFRILK